MSQQQNQVKPKLGQRLARAFLVGSSLGFLLFIIVYFFATAVNAIAGSAVVPAVPFALFSFAMGLALSIGVELSKDIEQG